MAADKGIFVNLTAPPTCSYGIPEDELEGLELWEGQGLRLWHSDRVRRLPPSVRCPLLNVLASYRTLSVRVDEKNLPAKAKAGADPADAIASIDVHLITPEEVYTRYSTHPVHGLDDAAVQRKIKEGKNVISPPPTQYWKKALNYIFGGFNFLMWIAFILTLVRMSQSNPSSVCSLLFLTVVV